MYQVGGGGMSSLSRALGVTEQNCVRFSGGFQSGLAQRLSCAQVSLGVCLQLLHVTTLTTHLG